MAPDICKQIIEKFEINKDQQEETILKGHRSFKEIQLNKEEAPVRKLMYELFLDCKRKNTVAKKLNEQGYRTRNGSKFSGNTITRLLRDPIAKGLRRANYTKSLGDGKHWELKESKDWVFTKAPIIIDEEKWNQVQQILDEQA